MNRKTLLALAAVAATGATFAAVTANSANTLCRIALELKSKEAVIALPLVDVRGSGSTIDVTKFVLTDNLVVGTTLQYKSGENWVGWQLTQKDSKNEWTAANVENSESLTEDLERGGAVLLTRPLSDEATSRTVYLYGQVSEAAVAKVPVNGYNLYGNTGTTAMTDVSAIGITPQNGDQVIVPTTWTTRSGAVVQIFDYYTYTKTDETVGSWDKDLSIPVGTGFWYKR